MIDADAAIVLKGLAEVVPEGELAGFAGVEVAEGVGVAEGEKGAVGGAGFGLEEGIAEPGRGLVTVDVFGDDVEVATDEGRGAGLEPAGHLLFEAGHPGELVGELLGADGVAVGEIDVDDADALDEGLEEAGVTILLVAGEGGGNGLDGVAGEDGDAVVGLLGDSGGPVADGLEDVGGEVSAFELLEEEDVGLVDLEPGEDGFETGADGVDVPGGDADGEFLFCPWLEEVELPEVVEMEDAFDLAGGFDDDEGGNAAGLHEGEGGGGEGAGGDGDRGGIHDVGGGEREGVGAGALEHAAEVAVGDDAEEPVVAAENGGEAELLAGHLVDDVGHEGDGGDDGEVVAGVHEVADAGEFEAEAAAGVEIGEVLGGEAAALAEGEGEGVAEGKHDGGGGGGGKIVRAGLFGDGEVEREICGAGEGGGGVAAESDEREVEAMGDRKEGEEFFGFAAGGEKEEGVRGGEHAEVAVEGLGGVEEVGGGSGGAEGGGDLPRDQATFADAGEEERTAGSDGAFEEVEGRGEGLMEVGVETVSEGGEGGGFSGDDFCGGDVGLVAGSVARHRRDAIRA